MWPPLYTAALEFAHQKLDRAVLAAYAAVDPDGQWAQDWADVWLDTGAGQPLPDDHQLANRRRRPGGFSSADPARVGPDATGCH